MCRELCSSDGRPYYSLPWRTRESIVEERQHRLRRLADRRSHGVSTIGRSVKSSRSSSRRSDRHGLLGVRRYPLNRVISTAEISSSSHSRPGGIRQTFDSTGSWELRKFMANVSRQVPQWELCRKHHDCAADCQSRMPKTRQLPEVCAGSKSKGPQIRSAAKGTPSSISAFFRKRPALCMAHSTTAISNTLLRDNWVW